MKKVFFVVLLLGSLVPFGLAQTIDDLQFMTEEFPPISYRDGNKAKGLAVEIVQEMLNRNQSTNKIHVFPWARALRYTKAKNNGALFGTTWTEQRDSLFHWVGPLVIAQSSFYTKSDSNLVISNLEQAKDYSIGTQFASSNEEFLKTHGFTKLYSNRDNSLNLKMLMVGRLDAVAGVNLVFNQLIDELQINTNDIQKQHTFRTLKLYLALSKGVPESTVKQLRHTLDTMKRDGTFNQIYNKWLPGEIPPGVE